MAAEYRQGIGTGKGDKCGPAVQGNYATAQHRTIRKARLVGPFLAQGHHANKIADLAP